MFKPTEITLKMALKTIQLKEDIFFTVYECHRKCSRPLHNRGGLGIRFR